MGINKGKIKRYIYVILAIFIFYLLQCTVFSFLQLANIRPNLLLILTATLGFMRGQKEGMLVGFFSGLLLDIQFGSFLGFYALVYLIIGYANGMFYKHFYEEDFKLPLILISASELIYGHIIYVSMFLLRSDFRYPYYLGHTIMQELVYTVLVALIIYPVLLYMNQKLEIEEKRSADRSV